MENPKVSCSNCGRNDSQYCEICVDEDMFLTKEEKEELDALCDLMCGCPEEEE